MKSAARVARKIEADIGDRGWPAGERLGSEAQLMRRYGVGRGPVREAVRILEDRQLVRPQEGRRGGLMITAPDIDGVAAAARAFLWHGKVGEHHLYPLWNALLTAATGALANAIDSPGADSLIADWPALTATVTPDAANASWSPVALHTEILRRAGSPPAVLALRATIEPWGPRLSGTDAIHFARACHARLLTALVCGDAATAQSEMREFFHHFSPTDFGPLSLSRQTRAQKLGRRTAEDLLEEIRRRGWPVDEWLGTERDLQERLGVSRAPLREAIRLLESWSVLEAGRGNGGGLFIAAPNPTAVREAARAWLDHAGTSRSAIFAARTPLEVLAIRTLAKSATPTSIARLHDVLVDERRADADFVTGGPDAQRPSLSTEIARLSGNPALALFVPVLVDAVRAYGLSVSHPERGARWVAERHLALVAAVEARDADRAELLMRRYIAAVEQVPPMPTAPVDSN